MTKHKQKINVLLLMIFISFPFVLGYHIEEWFSLRQSSHDVLEDGRCSLLTYQGPLLFCILIVSVNIALIKTISFFRVVIYFNIK